MNSHPVKPFWGRLSGFLALGLVLGLSACVPFWKKTGGPPAAPVSNAIPPHETWCYKTWDAPQCFSSPQDLPADLLVMVDPPSLYPLTPEDYRKAVESAKAVEKEKKEEAQKNASSIQSGATVSGPVILTPPGDLSARR